MFERFNQSGIRRLPRDIEPHQGEIIVIGLGRFGSALATTLMSLGHEVLGVDQDELRVQEHSGQLTHVVQADTTSESALIQIGAKDAVTVAVCIGTDIEASVLTTAALADLAVPNIWAKAITNAHGRILKKVGARNVVFPEADMGERVGHLLTGQMQEYVVLDENFVIAELNTPVRYVDRTLAESNIRDAHNVTVVVVKPAGQNFTYAQPDTVLRKGDLVVVAGTRDDVNSFADS